MGKVTEPGPGKDYEDTETCALSLGVLSALALAFVVALQYQVDPTYNHYADFRNLICRSADFREFVVDVLDGSSMAARYGANFTVPIGAGKTLEIRNELQSNIHDRHGEVKGLSAGDCYKDGLVIATVQWVYHEVPGHLLNVWYSQNQDFYRFSDHMEKNAVIAGALLFVSLVWSVCLYNSLSLSPAREDDTGGSLKRWLKLGKPCLILAYLVFLSGVSMFLATHIQFMSTKTAHHGASEQNHLFVGIYYAIVPGAGVGLILALVLKVLSGKGYSREDDGSTTSPVVHAGHGSHQHTGPSSFRHEI